MNIEWCTRELMGSAIFNPLTDSLVQMQLNLLVKRSNKMKHIIYKSHVINNCEIWQDCFALVTNK